MMFASPGFGRVAPTSYDLCHGACIVKFLQWRARLLVFAMADYIINCMPRCLHQYNHFVSIARLLGFRVWFFCFLVFFFFLN